MEEGDGRISGWGERSDILANKKMPFQFIHGRFCAIQLTAVK